jgi:hypothetical protein
VIASFKYPFNARVHTKYSEVSPLRTMHECKTKKVS